MSLYVGVCIGFIILLLVTLFDSLRRKVNLKALSDFITLLIFVLIAMIFFTLSLVVENPQLKIMFHELKFIGIVSIPYITLSLYARFTRGGGLYSLREVIKWETIPLITVIIAFTNRYHHLFRLDYYFVEYGGVSFMNATPGPWFYVHTLYSYMLSLIGLSYLVRTIPKIPKIYREQLWVLFGTGVALFLVSTIGVSGILFTDYGDITLLSFCVAVLVQYYWLLRFSPQKTINLARNLAVQEIKSPILVFDNNDLFLDANLSAREKFTLQKGDSFSDFVTKQLALAHAPETIEGQQVQFSEPENVSYQIADERLFDEDGKYFGRACCFNNISEIHMRSKKLTKMAAYDNLTGLHNSAVFRKTIDTLTDEDLPAVFVLVNINALRFWNSGVGYKAGDQVIRKVANMLVAHAPENHFAARTAGDEFVVILKKSTLEEGYAYIDAVRQALCETQVSHFPIRIASGVGIKQTTKENSSLLLKSMADDMAKEKIKTENKVDQAQTGQHRRSSADRQFQRELALLLGKAVCLDMDQLYQMYGAQDAVAAQKLALNEKSIQVLEISEWVSDLYLNQNKSMAEIEQEISEKEGKESEIATAFSAILR